MQVIYDLLVPNSAELPLREDPVLGAVPSGLTRVAVTTPRDVLRLLEDGTSRRKTERTDANACSSRSHAVFEVRCLRKHSCMHLREVDVPATSACPRAVACFASAGWMRRLDGRCRTWEHHAFRSVALRGLDYAMSATLVTGA